ncbi:MAG: transaldolase [Cellvibrionales bacterium TMED49]|nr:transaldolase [Porticoccaceae bacterium]OUU36960.1 MAG: transaldolase [Cellvibrionales bacterium TMED49]
MKSQLEQLKEITTVVADTGDFETISKFQPQDATTNPSLLLKAAKMPIYRQLVDETLDIVRHKNLSSKEQITVCMDTLAVRFGQKILAIIPGRVSTEIDARLSFSVDGSVAKAHELINQYEQVGIGADRVLIKMASTWEGIRAAEKLERDGINCNLTLLFSFSQAAAAGDAGVFLISPFVGRILDWYKLSTGKIYNVPSEDPGVQSVTEIYNYFKQKKFQTIVMGASFRNLGQITELAGCDSLTISPALLDELGKTFSQLEKKLDATNTGETKHFNLDGEASFRYKLNEDAMATEKLAEGIRIFVNDQIKLETWLRSL